MKNTAYINKTNHLNSNTQSPGLYPGRYFHRKSSLPQAIDVIQRMISQGFEDIDIIIQLHEEFPKELAEKALNHCKQTGIL